MEQLSQTKQLSPLEALQNIVNHLDLDVFLGGDYRHYRRDIKIVADALKDYEKKSKVLEIIKRNPTEIIELIVLDLYENFNAYEQYYNNEDWELDIKNQEEFDLLKEVLK